MLRRLVLGGVTLAAIGFGLKKYCDENGCPWDEKIYAFPCTTNKLFQEFQTSKQEFYSTLLPEFVSVFTKIENMGLSPLEETRPDLKQEYFATSTSGVAKAFIDTLHKSIGVLGILLKSFKELIDKKNNYAHFSDEEQMKLQIVYTMLQNMTELFHTNIFDTNGEISQNFLAYIKTNKILLKRLQEIYPFLAWVSFAK